MATESQVKAGLDDIAEAIRVRRSEIASAKQAITNAKATLNELPTLHADVIATIGAYTPTGAFESLSQDELAKLTAEFQALVADAAAAETALANV